MGIDGPPHIVPCPWALQRMCIQAVWIDGRLLGLQVPFLSAEL